MQQSVTDFLAINLKFTLPYQSTALTTTDKAKNGSKVNTERNLILNKLKTTVVEFLFSRALLKSSLCVLDVLITSHKASYFNFFFTLKLGNAFASL